MKISVSQMSKIFRISHERDNTIYHTFNNIIRGIKHENFHVLKNINLEVHDGECIGIIGENGSGKSTLLKIIAKILVPTSGEVITEGKLVPLMELGTGMQEDLTAKENIFLYGTIMGIKRIEIISKYDSIIKFSELRRFEDTKLRHFSSGMRTRLAFAIAIATNPDILLLDEIFAVGDKNFQKKSINVLKGFKRQKKIIIMTSHHPKNIVSFCDKMIYLHKGKIVMIDRPLKVIRYYESRKS
jgi:lipopolysaccharide transport system ATP-binding protein